VNYQHMLITVTQTQLTPWGKQHTSTALTTLTPILINPPR